MTTGRYPRCHLGLVVREQELMELPAQYLLWLVPEHFRHTPVNQRGYELFIEFPNAFGCCINEPAVPLLALPKFLLRFFALSEFPHKPLVGLFETFACHADFFERAGVGDGRSYVMSENRAPGPEFLLKRLASG